MQDDAGITLSALADCVGVSPSAAQRRLRRLQRLQRLREDNVILRDVSLLNPKLIAPSVTMLVELELERERPELIASLHLWIALSAEVQQTWCLTGHGDYTLGRANMPEIVRQYCIQKSVSAAAQSAALGLPYQCRHCAIE